MLLLCYFYTHSILILYRSPIVRDRRALGGMCTGAWEWGLQEGAAEGAGEGGARAAEMGRGDMGENLTVRKSLEASLSIPSPRLMSVRGIAGDDDAPGVAGWGGGAGSPLKKVGVGNAGVLVRKARQVERCCV